MRVYHGSTMVIDRPIAAAGRRRLDFGQKVIDECMTFVESYNI